MFYEDAWPTGLAFIERKVSGWEKPHAFGTTLHPHFLGHGRTKVKENVP